jgi:hypothetical protein
LAHFLRKSDLNGVVAALLLLLVAQFGAQWHSYAHGEAGAHEVQGSAALAGHGACSDCLSFSPLLSATGTPAALPSLVLPLMADAPVARLASLLDHGLTLAFRSRAPPR